MAAATMTPSRPGPPSTNSPRVEPAELDDFAAFCSELKLENKTPLELHPFQRVMLADYFRGCTETLILIPKKNGKSTLLSALALYHLVVTPDAECVIAAASRDQAAIMLRQARGFITRSESLQRLMKVKQREITSLVDDGRIRVLASDVDTADGVIPTLALVDELHRHKSADLYGVFRDGLGPRDGRMITISTAGDDEESPLGKMRLAALALPGYREGAYRYAATTDRAYVMHEWALEVGEDREDMAVVCGANPAPWQDEEALSRRFDSPSMTTWQWARFACGVWLQGESSAIQPEEWDALKDRAAMIPPGSEVWVGMDLGWKWASDVTALVPLWWQSDKRRIVGAPVIVDPPNDGSLLDDRKIVDALVRLAKVYRIRVVYDPEAGGQQLVQQVEREHRIAFIEHSQKNGPISLADGRMMEAIRQKVLIHNGDERLRLHALNAVEKPLGGDAFKFDRASRGPRKPYDALRALSMAHSVAVSEASRKPALAHFL